ncbi:MAG: TlpA disulfide reductase family protein, partial [Saprospiraceae bacterium]
YKGTIDPTGKFFIQAELESAGIYTISFGYESINVFVIPGDRISLTGDARSLKYAATFKGSHAIENNYLVSYENLKNSTQDKSFESFFSQPESSFTEAVEKRVQYITAEQQDYQKKNGVFDAIFGELINDEISYDAAILKMNYPYYLKYIYPDSTILLSETYDSFLQNIDTDNEQNLWVPSYKIFLPLYLSYKSQNDSTKGELPSAQLRMKNIAVLFRSVKVKDLLYFNLMKETLEMSIDDASLIIDDFNRLEKNKNYLTAINGEYEQWKHLAKGQPAPPWEYNNLNGQRISLESLKGKVVFIDVWATWCMPCLQELPYLEQTQGSFSKNSDIVFVSISIDQDKDAWQKMVRQKKLKGVQLIADNAWGSSIISHYKISGIPRFIIIGKNGNIISANAVRPSSKELKTILDNALNV